MGDNSSEKRTLEPIIDDDTKRRLWDEAQKATPDHVLETQLHDSRIPKPEIVHYASRKIKALEEEIERLRKAVEDWHDAAVRAERNAAMSQEETLAHIDRLAALMDENERLRRCCTQRGARMQIMRDWLDSNQGLGPPTEWWYFCEERPEAKEWFDEDGVPVDTAMREGK